MSFQRIQSVKSYMGSFESIPELYPGDTYYANDTMKYYIVDLQGQFVEVGGGGNPEGYLATGTGAGGDLIVTIGEVGESAIVIDSIQGTLKLDADVELIDTSFTIYDRDPSTGNANFSELGYSGFEIRRRDTGNKRASYDENRIVFGDITNDSFQTRITPSAIAATINVSLPSESGQFALTSEIPSFEGYSETGTIAGNDIIATIGDSGTFLKVDAVENEIRVQGFVPIAWTSGGGVGQTEINSTYIKMGSFGAAPTPTVGGGSMVWGISDEQSYAANADGQSAISFGRNTRAEGSYSQSFGYLSRTTESTATAFGFAGLSEGYSSFVAGRGNLATGVAEAIFGTSATAWANTSTSQGVPDAGDRIFAVGNGFGNYVTRPTDSDAFNILYSGEVTAPSLTIALIDTETTGRALTTREWVEANSVTYTGATQDLNLGANKIKAATLEVTATPSFADDAAAGVGGLIVGQAYQTTGLGAAPLNVAGILMIKQ